MKTDDLIRALGADSRRPAMTLAAALAAALALAIIVAAIVFAATIGPRPDIAAAAATARFLFKFVVTTVLAATAFIVLTALSRPGPAPRSVLWLAAAPLLLAAAVTLELAVVPETDWGRRLVGSNSLACLAMIPLIGIGPLALFVAALRHGAPAYPSLAGAVAGLAAGGLAATLYAAHCTDDSPLFVATWYMLAIAALAAIGALAGHAFARW